MPSIFTKIIAGEIPCHKVAEDDEFIAFLDIRPVNEGHTLVVPKQETDYIFDIEDGQLARMMLFAKKVAAAMKRTIECNRIGIMVIGLEVPHAHIHLIPITKEGDMYNRGRSEYTNERLAAIAGKIKEAIAANS
jgi:histidine triad (HIT) family protein